jgi:hypothetical protein
MSYTYTSKARALVWLSVFGLLVALSGSGGVVGSWALLLVVAALGVPLIVTVWAKPRSPTGAATTSQGRALVVSEARNRSPLDASGIDVSEWENDGGARSTLFSGGVPEPVQVAQ